MDVLRVVHKGTLMAKIRDGKFCLRALDLVGGAAQQAEGGLF
jgi:hypothetical protein